MPAPTPAPARQQGTPGNDKLTGTASADLLEGGAGQDRLLGRGGDDILTGGEGRDRLFGGAGNDLLDGGAGNDILRGGPGDDRLVTGAGNDTVVFGNGDGRDHVTDFTLGSDSLRLAGGLEADEVAAGLTTREGVSGLLLTLPGGETLFLTGLDLVTAEELGLDGAFAMADVPPVAEALEAPTPEAPAASAPATTTTVEGTAGDDWLQGGDGADLLLGGAGVDDLQGGAGDDVLRGGTGHDGLTGGAGADSFAFARGDGDDWVVDFTPGEDLIQLEGFAFADIVQRTEPRWDYQGLVLDLGQGDEIYLQGVTAPLQPRDIVFA
jgi:Ca2+-binding RTX toxin-like protein